MKHLTGPLVNAGSLGQSSQLGAHHCRQEAWHLRRHGLQGHAESRCVKLRSLSEGGGVFSWGCFPGRRDPGLL